MENSTIINSQKLDKHFYRRVGGILLLALAFLWLEQFKGTMFMVAKIEFVLAAILYTKMPRYFNKARSFRLEKEWRSGKDWVIAITAGMLMGTAVTVFGRLEPDSMVNNFKFVAGAGVIMYAVEMILGKSIRIQATN